MERKTQYLSKGDTQYEKEKRLTFDSVCFCGPVEDREDRVSFRRNNIFNMYQIYKYKKYEYSCCSNWIIIKTSRNIENFL